MAKLLQRVPLSLEADTRIELTQKCLATNVRLDMECNYFDIQKDKGKWIAWYYVDLAALKRQGRKVSDG